MAAIVMKCWDEVVSVIGPFTSRDAAATFAEARAWRKEVSVEVVPLYEPAELPDPPPARPPLRSVP